MNVAAGRSAKFSNVDLSTIKVVRATTDDDFATVAMLRANGFARSLRTLDPKVIQWIDVADRNGSAFTLIAYEANGRPAGTVRLQDSRKGTLELHRFVELSSILPFTERPAVQISRLSAMRGPRSGAVVLALFAAAWGWCLAEGIKSMVVAIPRRSRPLYDYLQFTDLGPAGRFRHAFSGSLPHMTMRLAVHEVEAQMREGKHPLDAQFRAVAEQLGLNN